MFRTMPELLVSYAENNPVEQHMHNMGLLMKVHFRPTFIFFYMYSPLMSYCTQT